MRSFGKVVGSKPVVRGCFVSIPGTQTHGFENMQNQNTNLGSFSKDELSKRSISRLIAVSERNAKSVSIREYAALAMDVKDFITIGYQMRNVNDNGIQMFDPIIGVSFIILW